MKERCEGREVLMLLPAVSSAIPVTGSIDLQRCRVGSSTSSIRNGQSFWVGCKGHHKRCVNLRKFHPFDQLPAFDKSAHAAALTPQALSSLYDTTINLAAKDGLHHMYSPYLAHETLIASYAHKSGSL